MSNCSFYQRVIRRNRQNVASFALFLNVIENFALLGLSLYTSVDNYGKLISNAIPLLKLRLDNGGLGPYRPD